MSLIDETNLQDFQSQFKTEILKLTPPKFPEEENAYLASDGNWYPIELPPPVKSFSQCTDAEITKALEKHRNGEIDLTEYWSVGEERSVHISAMEAIGVGESHVEQDQTLVILHGPDCFDLVDGGKNLFVIGLKGLLFNNTTLMFERGYINSIPTNLGGWKDSNRRSWCDDVFMKALPEEVQKWFKYLAGKGSKSTETDELENYFTFPCQFEVFKTNTRAAAENTIQFDYYTIEANRIKYKDGSTTTSTYWMRSASTSSTAQFLAVSYEGKSSYISATNNSGLAPFGCV